MRGWGGQVQSSSSVVASSLDNASVNFDDDAMEDDDEIDAMNVRLQPLRSFILPGGSALAAHLHVCRTVSRRAERLTVELATMEAINTEAVKYLNRLSDWFFVAGRIANDDGKADVLWVPGLTRDV